MKVLVTGATGFLGSHIVDQALEAGDEVRVLARPTGDLGYLRSLPDVEIVHGDLGDAESLAAACKGWTWCITVPGGWPRPVIVTSSGRPMSWAPGV